MPLLLLVDGSSYLYRAFHALPDLRNKAGEPTGAIYGVLNMLRRLESDYKADYKAVVFDAKGKTFRDDWFPEYKAHRPPMPDDLVQQIEPLHAAIKAAGWPLLMVDGVEADDVIGTLATNATVEGINSLISTGDKDLTQLVNDHVRWYNTMSNELLDVAGVEAKFGVPPDKIVDYLALVGDTVDGVPGVAKCGPKTALKWLAQYGSLDGIVAHADEIGGVVGQNLRDHLGFLPLGKKLVTVACDLSNLPAPTELITAPRDTDALRALYTRYQFPTWLGEIDGPEAATVGPARRRLLHPARPYRPWRPGPAATRRGAGPAKALAGVRRAQEAAAERKVPPARLRQPWHHAGRHRPRHHAAELRARIRQGPRPRPAVHPPPRARDHRLRGFVRQGRQADRLRPGRPRARRNLRRRGRRRHA